MLKHIALIAALGATPALAQSEPAYLDNGSTPRLLVESFYNAISRFEIGRAWGYLNPDVRPDYSTFFTQFEPIRSATPRFGPVATNARAGEIFYTLPIIVELVDDQGAQSYETGCIGVGWPLPDAWDMGPYPMPYVNYGGMQRVEGAAAEVLLPVCE